LGHGVAVLDTIGDFEEAGTKVIDGVTDGRGVLLGVGVEEGEKVCVGILVNVGVIVGAGVGGLPCTRNLPFPTNSSPTKFCTS
jgi:hypothetical protein